jgi:nicotinamidase-related amidase
VLAVLEDSVVVVVDLQANFLKVIHEADRVVERSKFLIDCAQCLSVPVIATTQNAERMGGLHPALGQSGVTVDKMEFGCWGNSDFRSAVMLSSRRQVVVVGVEAHICVMQTSLEMVEAGFEVTACVDAVSARQADHVKVATKRMRDAGVVVSHTESVVYEWMRTAAHPQFRDVLAIVKAQA